MWREGGAFSCFCLTSSQRKIPDHSMGTEEVLLRNSVDWEEAAPGKGDQPSVSEPKKVSGI